MPEQLEQTEQLSTRDRVKAVSMNTWVLSLISALVIGSFAMNVNAIASNRTADQNEWRTADAALGSDVSELKSAFSKSVETLDRLGRELDLRVTILEERERVASRRKEGI